MFVIANQIHTSLIFFKLLALEWSTIRDSNRVGSSLSRKNQTRVGVPSSNEHIGYNTVKLITTVKKCFRVNTHRL
jgi:hypothetical protein